MTLYSIALFLHIVGALLLFVLLTIEGLALRQGFTAARLNRALGPIAALAILVPGIYMTVSQWGWKGWIVVGITSVGSGWRSRPWRRRYCGSMVYASRPQVARALSPECCWKGCHSTLPPASLSLSLESQAAVRPSQPVRS